MNITELHPLLCNLYGAQAQAIDSGDGSAWADTYTEEGTYESPSYERTYSGRKELTDFGNSFPTRSPNSRHLVLNVHITDIGEDKAKAILTYVIVAGDPGGVCQILRTVTAFDDIKLVDGQPKLAARRIKF